MTNGVYNYFPDPANQSIVINQSYTFANGGGTPDIVWVVLALAAFAFLVLAFYYRLRDETGAVNTSRVMYSLLGTVVAGAAAWASLVIDVINGTSTATIANFTVSISQHTLYEMPGVAVLFVLVGLVCLANLVYTLVQPELLVPERDELRGKSQDAEVKAEKE